MPRVARVSGRRAQLSFCDVQRLVQQRPGGIELPRVDELDANIATGHQLLCASAALRPPPELTMIT